LIRPDYDLTVVRRKGNSQELVPERVIHFSRTDLQLYRQDMYDAKGAIQTTAIYGPMGTFGQQNFPGTVTALSETTQHVLVRACHLTQETTV
jgi:hypothetical protein